MKNLLSNKLIATICLFTLSLISAFGQTTRTRPVKAPVKNNQIQQKYSVYFDVNQSKIKPNDYKVIDSVITLLKGNVNIRRILINGYADTTGGADANLALSERRTDTVANYILGQGLSQYKNRITTASLGEKINGKEADLNEMRRVDIVLFLAKPDRDTVLRVGCASATIKANSFEGFNTDEIVFSLEYISTAEEAKKNNIEFVDDSGNALLSNGVLRLTAMYKGKPVKAILPITIQLPRLNFESNYSLYTGVEEKGKAIYWKKTSTPINNIGKKVNAEGDACDLQSFTINDLNKWYNADKKMPACYCSPDPFGGFQTPTQSSSLEHFGKDKSIVVLNNSCFKKIDAGNVNFQLLDNLYPETFLNFCNGFLLPGVGDIPDLSKFDHELIKFIDFNVSEKNDSAEIIMVKKSKVLILIPKSKFPAHEGKQYALLPADTKKDDYFSWTNKPVLVSACLGLANCDYWVFEAPFTGFYALLELTPQERKSRRKSKDDDASEEEEIQPKYIRVKTKKFNNVLLVYGAKDEDKTQSATFLKNKGKHSFNLPSITKKEKKEYKDHVFMAYVVVNGKRYAWIGKGSDLKTNFFTGQWKTPKLVYVPDEDWEEFVKKACE